jgi:hypothetical protein
MNCKEAGEYISALCDGERIPRAAAEHLGGCEACREHLNDYAAIGSELRRLASLDELSPSMHVDYGQPLNKVGWWQRGLTTMKIPKLAFGVMLIAIIALSSGLVIVRARAGAATGRFLELKFKIAPSGLARSGREDICIMRLDRSEKDNTCNFVDHGREALLLMSTSLVGRVGDSAQLRIRAKYVPGDGDAEVNYTEALFKDVPEKVLSLEPGERRDVEVAGLGKIEVEGEYLDHIPPLVYRPQETLDPNPREFRIVAPVLVRDNKVIANADGSSIDTGDSDATLMLYVPGEGRYLVSLVPFENAVEGNAHLGKITFSLQGHDYLLLTSTPITVSEHVWVKHESGFKPSEHMTRQSDARDDRTNYMVRSLRKLQQERIDH